MGVTVIKFNAKWTPGTFSSDHLLNKGATIKQSLNEAAQIRTPLNLLQLYYQQPTHSRIKERRPLHSLLHPQQHLQSHKTHSTQEQPP